MRLFRPSLIAGWLYPEAIFRISTTEKVLCLTFDDGPDPDSTPQLLDILDKYDIKALFFCNGRAAEKYPGLIKRIISKGHLIGNHGYNHLNGWVTSRESYVADVANAAPYTSSSLFRPPYGHLRFNQYKKLGETYKIVFWDIMPYDFDSRLSSKKSLLILKKKIRPGSVIVLHDNTKNKSTEFIEDFILFTRNEGYRFDNSVVFGSSPG
ncbi:MAG: polysaccharide deacetylase family protein [Bacteroidia bacterium]|nr:polysaccharide deacetylase family protein [Bacteroidia bacterium]